MRTLVVMIKPYLPIGATGIALLCSLVQPVAADLFYTAYRNGGVTRIDEATGQEIDVVAPRIGYQQGFEDFVGLAFGPDNLLYVSARHYGGSSFGRWGVFSFNASTGDFLGTLVDDGPLYNITFGPDGDLYGVDSWSDDLVKYDIATGAPPQRILRGDDFGYYGVGAFTFLPDGSLFAITNSDEIARYDLETGVRISPATSLAGLGFDGYGFDRLALGPTGDVYATYNYRFRDQVLDGGVMRFDGVTGSLLDVLIDDTPAFGAASGGDLGLAFGPGGELYVGSQYASAILRYNPVTGALLGTLPIAPGTRGAGYLAFLPVPEPRSIASLLVALSILAISRARLASRAHLGHVAAGMH